MRTNIDIDDQLMETAMKVSGTHTKKETVELGLKTLVQLAEQSEIKKLKGTLTWHGDLDDMRTYC